MAGEIELTLKELTQIALGAPEVTDVNVAVLQSLFDIILRKLNCEHELVSFGGVEASCVRKLTDVSKISPLYFNDDKILSLSEKFKLMDELEQKTRDVEIKLQKHFKGIEKCLTNIQLPVARNKFPTYAHFCEDLIIFPDMDNKLVTYLLNNRQFLVKMMCILSSPLVEKMLNLERIVKKLNSDYTSVALWSKEEYNRIYLIEACARDVGKLKDSLEAIVKKFDSAMDEVEQMLDTKLDKVHLPPLKLYIDTLLEEFDKIEEEEPHCPGVIKISSTERCLACGSTPEQRNRPRVPSSSLQKKLETCDNSKQLPNMCGYHNVVKPKRTLHDRIEQLDLAAVQQAIDLNLWLKRLSQQLTTTIFPVDPMPKHVSIIETDQTTELRRMQVNARVLKYLGLDSVL